jgi:acetolactate synthase-1/2/3 large subunit
MTAVEWFVGRLCEHGVKWIATLCGFGLDPLYQAARRAGLRLVDTRNEQTAGYIADYTGRLTRRPGVCAVSSGVAHANALTGVVSAYFDGSPMLLITGAGPLATAGMGHFQDFPQAAMAAPVTRYCRTIDSPARAVQILDEALAAAMGPPPGPVHLSFPMDVQTAEVSEHDLVRGVLRPPPVCRSDSNAAAALAASERPLLVAGSGLYYSGEADAMLRFSERFAIPVVAPIWDRGAIDRPARTFMGVIGAATGGPRLLADADCIVMAGAAADYRVGFLQPGAVSAQARIVFCDQGWEALEAAYQQAGGPVHAAWLAEAQRRNGEFRQAVERRGRRQAEQGMHAWHIIAALRQVLTEETVLLIDGGSIGQWAHQALCDRYPGHWLTCGRSGVVGWGIGGAMAARLVYPDRPVILLAGDGAFTFNVADLENAARQSLPFVAVVADDQGWGITRLGHLEKFGEPIASALGPIAIDRLAESLGARGIRIEQPQELAPALGEALAGGRLTVIQVPIIGGNPGAEEESRHAQ